MSRSQRIILAVVLWLAAIAVAAALDPLIATTMRDSGVADFVQTHTLLRQLLKAPGEFYFTAMVVVVVALAHSLNWRAGGFLLLATAISGANGLIKWMVGRIRPFKMGTLLAPQPYDLEPFAGGWAGLFHSKNLCFPSGHAALAFATAAAVAMLWPTARWRWAAFAVAGVVAVERVAENAHWLSDVVAAAALGIGGVHLIHWIVIRVVHVEEKHDAQLPLTA